MSDLTYKNYSVADIQGMNTIKEVKKAGKEMGISGYTTWKKKNGDIEKAKRLMISEIQEERKEGEEYEKVQTRRDDNEEAKRNLASNLADLTGQSIDWFMTKDLDYLNTLARDLEDADLRINSAPPLPSSDPTSLSGRPSYEDDIVDTSMIRDKDKPPIPRRLPETRGQEVLSKSGLAMNEMDVEDALTEAIKKGDMKAVEKILEDGGVPVEEIKGVVDTARKMNKALNKKSFEDGSWLTKGLAALGAPELAAWQAGMDALGLGMTPKDRQDLNDLINGDFKGSTGDGLKLMMKAGANPTAWANMFSATAKKRGEKVYNDFTDIFTKADIYKDRDESEAPVQNIIANRKNIIKQQEKEGRELNILQGNDDDKYSGVTYKEGKDFEQDITAPHLKEYGGSEDLAWWEKVGKFFVDAGIALAEEMADPLGFIEIVGGKAVKSDRLKQMEERLKKKDPRSYALYNRAMKRHISTIEKASVTNRDTSLIENHKPIAKQLGNIMRVSLEENAALLREGKEGFLSREQVKEYLDYSKKLQTGNVSYREMARMNMRFNDAIGGAENLPENLREKYNQWTTEEKTMLSSRGAGDSELAIESDEVIKAEERSLQRARVDKENLKQRIKEEEIDDFNREVINSRTDQITTGYVDTDNKNRAELRPRIIWGNTDQYIPTEEEDRNDDLINAKMMMWDTLRTEDNKTDNPLLQAQLKAEANRYKNTFPTPPDNGFKKVVKENYNEKMGYETSYCKYTEVPVAFLKHSERQLIPVYAPISESMPLLRKPEEVQGEFTRLEPNQDTSINKRVNEMRMPNRFPERILRGYRGRTLLPPSKKFNPWINQNYIM
jgi:hypothetical protein